MPASCFPSYEFASRPRLQMANIDFTIACEHRVSETGPALVLWPALKASRKLDQGQPRSCLDYAGHHDAGSVLHADDMHADVSELLDLHLHRVSCQCCMWQHQSVIMPLCWCEVPRSPTTYCLRLACRFDQNNTTLLTCGHRFDCHQVRSWALHCNEQWAIDELCTVDPACFIGWHEV